MECLVGRDLTASSPCRGEELAIIMLRTSHHPKFERDLALSYNGIVVRSFG